MKLTTLTLALMFGANVFAVTASPFVLKWDSFATPGRKGLVAITPGTVVTLEPRKTNDVFAVFGVPVPESEKAHRAVSLEFRFRFLRETAVLERGTIRTDQHGTFTPAHHSTGPCDPYEPASQDLYSTEAFTVPVGADLLEIERAAVDSLKGTTKVSAPFTFALVGDAKSFLVASGDTRGDTKDSPPPFVMGGAMTAGEPLNFVFTQRRAMNAWVRTETSKLHGEGFVASMSGADSRTITCINKEPKSYYAAWAEIPLFEMVTRVRFDQGNWQEFPAVKLFPDWASGWMQDRHPFPYQTIPGIFRVADPHHPRLTTSIFPEPASHHLSPLHVQAITVPAQAKTLSVRTRLHAFLVAYYGEKFEGKPYVGDDCIKLYADGQRVELEDLWDSPDFTEQTAWTFPVN